MGVLKFFPLVAVSLLALSGCASNTFSPNTYSSNAVQLANKVEQGTIIGYREVKISANGTVGTVTGGAVGGVLGAEYANSALVAVGGTTIGGMLGNALEHAARDTTGWEYIIRKENGDMLSVTQRESAPLGLAQRVLVIMGPQARVVPDYSVPPEPKMAAAPEENKQEKKEAKVEPVKVEVVLSLPPGVTVQPKSDEIKVVAKEEEPAPALRPEPLEETIMNAVTMQIPLSQVLMEQPAAVVEPASEPLSEPVPDNAPSEAVSPDPVAEAAAEPALPPSQ
jgi:outer membrane lipoprotein SlyB